MNQMVGTPEVCAAIQQNLNGIQSWLEGMLVRFNKSKCRVLHLWRNVCASTG